MIIKTKHLGTLEVSEDKVITFPQGLFAFEEKKRYILLENEEPESPLWWLQSLDDPNLAFVLLNPFLFKPDYELELSAEDVEELGLEKPQEAAVFCLAVIPQDVKKMTANLLAPLVINAQLKKGKQIVLYHKNYTTKHLVLEEMQKAKQNCQGEGSPHVSTD
ncbi:MAG: flagellar assembly protein FliW [Clostridia bacterium]|nr:flagellar assembly protein FliW [Clostridia bacterium]